MSKVTFRTCHRHDFLDCELSQYVSGCLADIIDNEFHDDPQALAEFGLDQYDNGAVIRSVFGDILALNQSAINLFDSENKRKSWKKFIEARGKLNPFSFRFSPDLVESTPYQLRGSGFQSYGPAGLGSSIVNDDKLTAETGIEIKLSRLLRVGTTRHTIEELNSENIQAFVKQGIEPHQPSEFTEVAVEYALALNQLDFLHELEKNIPYKDKLFSYNRNLIDHDKIVIRGTIDAVLRVGDTLVIMDWKRGAQVEYEKINNKLQFSTYFYAFLQKYDKLHPDDKIKDGVIISVGRARNAKEGHRSKPIYHMTYLKRNDNFKNFLNRRIMKAYLEMREMYENPQLFIKAMDKFEDRIYKMSEEDSKYLRNYFDPNSRTKILYDYLKKGGEWDKVYNDGIEMRARQTSFKFGG